jgi:alpha-D-xyloside xylohydrolase
VAWRTTSEDYTPMRALIMDFPNDNRVLSVADEYMFGPAFLVSPVTTPKATSRSVYLPAGTGWVDFWTGKTLSGGSTVTAYAPVNIIPLHVRAGSIVALGPVVQYAMEKPADPIELRVYSGADGRFAFYEDEGDNYNYEKGKRAEIPFTWNESKQTLTVGKRSGDFPGMLMSRTFNIIWTTEGHGVGIASPAKPDAVVHYNGSAVKVSRPQ